MITENVKVKINAQTLNHLIGKYIFFQLLQGVRFLLLYPLLDLIKGNWKKARQASPPLLQEISHQDNPTKKFASMSAWLTTNHGLYLQAIVASSNNPLGLLQVMQKQLENAEGKHIQLWFEPSVKLNYNLFGPEAVEKLNRNLEIPLYESRKFHYLLISPFSFSPSISQRIQIVSYRTENSDAFLQFVIAQRGKVYAETEELDIADFALNELNQKYQRVGLSRKRKALLAYDSSLQEILGIAILYRGPLGINLSCLENKIDLLLSPQLSPLQGRGVLRALIQASQKYYLDFPFPYLPVITERQERDLLLQIDPKISEKEYFRSSVLGGEHSIQALQHYRVLLKKKENLLRKRLSREK